MSKPGTQTAADQRAIRRLEAKGYTVVPPHPAFPHSCGKMMLDQCEYPVPWGDPGDTCTNVTNRFRRTRLGTMWLCEEHFDSPESELFAEAVENG